MSLSCSLRKFAERGGVVAGRLCFASTTIMMSWVARRRFHVAHVSCSGEKRMLETRSLATFGIPFSIVLLRVMLV